MDQQGNFNEYLATFQITKSFPCKAFVPYGNVLKYVRNITTVRSMYLHVYGR